MQTEISKMSDLQVLDFILLLNTSMTEYKMLKYYQNSDLIHTQLKEAKELFLKRLSKNNIEEFKKSLIQEVNNTSFKIVNLEQDKIDDILRGTLINLIDNIGKE